MKTEPSSSLPYSYKLEEWIPQGKVAADVSLKAKNPEDAERLLKSFFESEYPDLLEREWKYARFYRGISYIDHHIEELDFGKVAVVGESQAMMSKNLWIAMWFAFGNVSESDLSNLPTPGQVLFMVEEIAKKRAQDERYRQILEALSKSESPVELETLRQAYSFGLDRFMNDLEELTTDHRIAVVGPDPRREHIGGNDKVVGKVKITPWGEELLANDGPHQT
jgi:hypothetical protein